MIVKTCQCGCGQQFEAKRMAAKYLNPSHGKRVTRRVHGAELASVTTLLAPEREPVEGELARTTREQLEAAHRADTPLGVAVLLMANRLDNVALYETGSSLAALVREWAAKLDAAVKHAEVDGGALEEIRGAALELIRGSHGA
jgi:hypothetical protein